MAWIPLLGPLAARRQLAALLEHDDVVGAQDGDTFTAALRTPRGTVDVVVEVEALSARIEVSRPVLGAPDGVELDVTNLAVGGEPEDVAARVRRDVTAQRALQRWFAMASRGARCTLQGGRLAFTSWGDRAPDRAELLEVAVPLHDLHAVVRGVLRLGDVEPCPSCRDVGLTLGAGPLGESACPSCGGRLLPPDAVAVVVQGASGTSPGELSAAADGARGTGVTCTACARVMAPVVLGDVIVDLCRGCGRMWLDARELSALSLGRFEG